MVFLRCIRGLYSPSSGLSYVAENPVANVGGVLDVATSAGNGCEEMNGICTWGLGRISCAVIGFNPAAAADSEEWRCTAEGSDIIGRPNECDMLNIPIPGLGLMDAYIENWGIGTLGIPACGIHEAWHVTPPLMDSVWWTEKETS